MTRRSQLPAVARLARMADALAANRAVTRENAQPLCAFLSHLRQTGEAKLRMLGLAGPRRSDFEKVEGRALVLGMAAEGMGATTVRGRPGRASTADYEGGDECCSRLSLALRRRGDGMMGGGIKSLARLGTGTGGGPFPAKLRTKISHTKIQP